MAAQITSKKVRFVTLNSDFEILKKFYSDVNLHSLNYDYVAAFNYNKNGKIDLINILTCNSETICKITKKEIEKVNTKLLSKQKIPALKEKSKSDNKSLKLLFLYNCFFCNKEVN